MPVKIAQFFHHSLKLRGAWRITREPPGEKTIVIQSSHLHGILENFAIGAEMQPVAVAVDWQHAQINVFRKPAVQSHFRFACGAPFFARREIEKTEVNRLFDFVSVR